MLADRQPEYGCEALTRTPASPSRDRAKLDIRGLSGIVLETAQEVSDMAKLYYTPREAAEILAISDDAVLDLVKRGEIPALRLSTRITRIPMVAFDRWREGYRPRRRRVSITPARRHVEVGAGERLPAGRDLVTR